MCAASFCLAVLIQVQGLQCVRPWSETCFNNHQQMS
jgi:hypothetical protein